MPSREEQRKHAIEACARRYKGLVLTMEAYAVLCESIAYGGAGAPRFVLQQEPGREVWEVRYQDRKLTAVYDTRRCNIVTFLPNGNMVPGQKTGREPPMKIDA